MNIEQEIKNLENKLTGNMLEDMDTRNQIHKLKMKLNNIIPETNIIECVGCSG